MKLKDKIAQDLIYRIGERGDIILPNYFLGNCEADVLRIRRSGLVYEYEIKTSRADYFNDFKKGFTGWNLPTSVKHNHLQNGQRKCNRFFFVVPDGLIKDSEVPEYAGLIYYENSGSFNPVLQGKLLCKKFPVDYEEIARKLSFRENMLRYKLRYPEMELEKLRDEIHYLKSQIKKEKIEEENSHKLITS